MFGNSYTALVIQINNREVGRAIWDSVKGSKYDNETERLRIHYFDLDIIIIQGTADYIASINEPINREINTKYGMLVQQRQIIIETCSNLAKNTFMRGHILDEEVDSVECARLSLVFNGYADILPFLSLINMPKQISSPPPRPVTVPPQAVAMQGRPIPTQPPHSPPGGYNYPVPRNPRPYPRNPPMNPPPNPPRPPRPGNYPRTPRPMPPRNMYVPRPLPPRPPFGNTPPRPRM